MYQFLISHRSCRLLSLFSILFLCFPLDNFKVSVFYLPDSFFCLFYSDFDTLSCSENCIFVCVFFTSRIYLILFNDFYLYVKFLTFLIYWFFISLNCHSVSSCHSLSYLKIAISHSLLDKLQVPMSLCLFTRRLL